MCGFKFKKGDYALCIIAETYYDEITEGKEYYVTLNSCGRFVDVIDNNGHPKVYSASRFTVPLRILRSNNIDEILKDE